MKTTCSWSKSSDEIDNSAQVIGKNTCKSTSSQFNGWTLPMAVQCHHKVRAKEGVLMVSYMEGIPYRLGISF